MKAKHKVAQAVRLGLSALLLFICANEARAQEYEVAFTSGGLKFGERGFNLPQPGRLRFDTGFTYQFNLAKRLLDARLAAVYAEFPVAGTPRTRVRASNALSPRSYSSLFFTPGLKLKLLPGSRYSPYLMTGVGLARFSESDTLTDDGPNPNPENKVRGVFNIGGGLDVKVFSILSIRGEVRDLYTDLPPLNINALRTRQHNALISAGFVLNF